MTNKEYVKLRIFSFLFFFMFTVDTCTLMSCQCSPSSLVRVDVIATIRDELSGVVPSIVVPHKMQLHCALGVRHPLPVPPTNCTAWTGADQRRGTADQEKDGIKSPTACYMQCTCCEHRNNSR